jgi:hypothetical protein
LTVHSISDIFYLVFFHQVTYSAKGERACARLCAANPECRAFTYQFTHQSTGPNRHDVCDGSQEEVEQKFGGYCYLKGAFIGWQREHKCSVSAVLPDPSGKRHAQSGKGELSVIVIFS